MSFFRSYSARIVTLALCAGVASAQTGAQSGNWTAPSGGYFYDSTNRSIRSLTGIIGSAVQGPSVATGIDWASVAPNQTSALAQQNGSQIWIPDLSAAGTFQVLDRFQPGGYPHRGRGTHLADKFQLRTDSRIDVESEVLWLVGFEPIELPPIGRSRGHSDRPSANVGGLESSCRGLSRRSGAAGRADR